MSLLLLTAVLLQIYSSKSTEKNGKKQKRPLAHKKQQNTYNNQNKNNRSCRKQFLLNAHEKSTNVERPYQNEASALKITNII